MKRFVSSFAIWVFVVIALFTVNITQAQDKQDPAADSKVIQETLNKIRDVEKLDSYIESNKALTTENKELKAQIASLVKQVNKLTQDLKTENERLRKQLLQLPTFEIKSKLIGTSSAMATLQFGEKSIRIRTGVEMTVPVADGVWTLMKVEKITIDLIEIYFPELDRRIRLFD